VDGRLGGAGRLGGPMHGHDGGHGGVDAPRRVLGFLARPGAGGVFAQDGVRRVAGQPGSRRHGSGPGRRPAGRTGLLAANVEPYLRADGTKVWSLMQLESEVEGLSMPRAWSMCWSRPVGRSCWGVGWPRWWRC